MFSHLQKYFSFTSLTCMSCSFINCKTRENSNFLRNSKTVISIKDPEFFWISDDETDLTVEFVSRNLATTSNFVEFQNSRNFTFFEAPRVAEDNVPCVKCSMSQTKGSSGTLRRHVATHNWVRIQSRWIKG